MNDFVERLRVGSDDLDEALVLCDKAADRIEALEVILRDATLILEQAQSCILQETPEDMTFGEAERDTVSKIRAFLNRE